MKPVNNTEFLGELPSRICGKLELQFDVIFGNRRNKKILSHYMRQIELRRMDIEAAALAASYDIVGKNKYEGKFKRDDQDTTDAFQSMQEEIRQEELLNALN
jgi:hypothetical protein